MINREELEGMLKDIFQGDIQFTVPMKDYTSLAIGGPADVFVMPDDPLSMRNIIMVLKKKGIPFIPFGGGTNILVLDKGIEEVVISTKAFKRIEVLQETNASAELFVEAGVPWQKLVNFCQERGYSGIEGLTGIPGTVGGAICGNAGSFGYEIKDVLLTVAIMDAHGRLERFKAEGLGFGYRTSDITRNDMVLSANIEVKRDEREVVSERTESFFNEKRKRQPLSEKSAGCVFKNPHDGSAGRLIDEAGCKGMRRGGIEVSVVHANFFINRGDGTASDYRSLMDEIASIVYKQFNINLEPEIKTVGRA